MVDPIHKLTSKYNNLILKIYRQIDYHTEAIKRLTSYRDLRLDIEDWPTLELYTLEENIEAKRILLVRNAGYKQFNTDLEELWRSQKKMGG